MKQSEKIEVVKTTTDRLARSQAVVFFDYKGLTVEEITALRSRMRESQGELKVVKNRLTKRALEAYGCETLDDLLVGPVALAFGYGEPTGPAKACVEFAKTNNKVKILGGLLEKKRIDVDMITALSKLPGRTELLGQMASTLMAPARQLATALNQSMAKVVYAMKARADQMDA